MKENDDKAEKFVESIKELLVTNIPEDATLDIIKAKQSEMIQKGRELTIKLCLRKKELSVLETKKDLAERHYKHIIMESQKEKLSKDKFTDKQIIIKVEECVNSDEKRETIGIYEKIKELSSKVEILETIWKQNDKIDSRVTNMLNATINIEKRTPNKN